MGGANVVAYHVSNPQRFGVAAFDPKTGIATSIEERPASPKSNWAVTRLDLYDGDVAHIAKNVSPNDRAYLERGDLRINRLGRGYAWLDKGTHDSLHEARSFVRTIDNRTGVKIACLEKVALVQGRLDGEDLLRRADGLSKTGYAGYLRGLARGPA